MTARSKGMAVLLAQVALVSSIAVKYAWERHACPRVWTRATQFDPQMPLRGRYLALNLEVNACGLPKLAASETFAWNAAHQLKPLAASQWNSIVVAENGKLKARSAEGGGVSPTQTVILTKETACDRARMAEAIDFFVAEHARTPFPLPAGQELWAEVTVPPSGPPRPIRLALSDGKEFVVLEPR